VAVGRRAGGYAGCNIDNIVGLECGKVVNLMVLEATQGDTSLRICTLNTHMSYAREAKDRQAVLVKAMEVTKHAECDTVVFVGDFNSRLHCDAPDPADGLGALRLSLGDEQPIQNWRGQGNGVREESRGVKKLVTNSA
jgi:hypothetical protein